MPGGKQNQNAGKKSKEKKRREKIDFPIVGIGSSAGGLEALEKFLTNMPPDPGMAFVLIQHLSPKHKSIMASLLSKCTGMKVMEIEDGTRVEPNCVYVTLPNKNVIISGGILHLREPIKTHGVNLPIDFFFRSLSEDQEERAICIILSGTAADGTLGIKAVKGGGGIAMVQAPESAKYDGMPRCAISTGLVDFILPVEEIPAQLLSYSRHPYIEGEEKHSLVETDARSYMQKIFALIQAATGNDFSHYKQNTIRRRIERRMAVHQVDKLSDYFHYLQKKQGEINILFKDLLIGVTSFFRDQEAFAVLKKSAIPVLLQDREPNSIVRIWVVGCATGEEAYSLAMVFSEWMMENKEFFNVQVFASDIDHQAIEYARQGIYPASIAADVSPGRLNNFFVKENSTYKVKKQIREMVIFAIQNVIKDPPFSRVDLVSCRNLMIYMDAYLQKRILPVFHYALNTNGLLFLGTSESIGEISDHFTHIDSKWKIYIHKQGALGQRMTYPDIPSHTFQGAASEEGEKRSRDLFNIHLAAEKIILDNYAPPGVIINEQNRIIQFIGETDRYLAPPPGKATFDLVKMAREGLRYRLTTALHSAGRQKTTVYSKGVRVKYNNEIRNVDLVVQPLEAKTAVKGFTLVLFDDKTPVPVPKGNNKKRVNKNGVDPEVVNLRQELQSTKEYLQTTIEELETSNEELRSTNEELQSVNEELQSTNEELETSKEELQSTNEELVTVNSELQKKIDELSRVHNDINNLLAGVEIGMIFLDANLCIKRYTPTTTRVFNLIKTDIGRPISDITPRIEYENLAEKAEKVLDTLGKIEMEVRTRNGDWFSMRLAPYRTLENVIEGVVITFLDIGKIKQTEKALRKSEERLSDAQLMANIGNWDWDLINDTIAWSEGMYSIFGLNKTKYKPDLASFFKFLHPDDQHLVLQEIFDRANIQKSYNLEYRIINQETLEISHINLRGETVYSVDNIPLRVAGIVQNIGRSKKAEESLRESEEKQRLRGGEPGEFVLILDVEANIRYCSRDFGDMTAALMMGKPFYNCVPGDSRDVMRACFERVLTTGAPQGYQIDCHTAGGGFQAVPVRGQVSPIKSADLVIALVVTGQEIKS